MDIIPFKSDLIDLYVMKKHQTLKNLYVIMFYFPLFTVPWYVIFNCNWIMPSTLIWAYLIVITSSQFE